jgi:hypothetical protein
MLNPDTNKNISKDSNTYKLLIKNDFNDIDGILIPVVQSKYVKLPSGEYLENHLYHKEVNTEVRFPKNGKLIKYKTAIKKDDYNLIFENNQIVMTPLDKSEFDKLENGTWILKGSKAHKQADIDNKIIKKWVYAPTKKKIPVGSHQFNKLVEHGYTYDAKTNVLAYPVENHMADISYPLGISDLNSIMESKSDETKVTALILIHSDQTTYIKVSELSKIVSQINNILYYDDAKAGILSWTTGGHEIKFGIAFNSGTDKNCVISELEKHCIKNNYTETAAIIAEMYIKYKYGVMYDDYEDISRRLLMKIVINLPNNGKIVFGGKRKQRTSFDCYYYNNHITQNPILHKNVKKVDILPELTYPDDFQDVINIFGDMQTPYEIETLDKISRSKYAMFEDKKIDLEGEISPVALFTKKIIEANPSLVPISCDNHNIDAIKSISQHGIRYSSGSDRSPVQSRSDLYTDFVQIYDLKKAYTTYKKCKYYSGFPCDLTHCINVKNLDYEKIQELISKEGFAFCTMKCLWSSKQISRWVSFPYVRHYMANRNDKITVIYLYIANKTLDDLNVDIPCIKNSKRAWHYVLGNFNKTKTHLSYCTTDDVLADTGNGCVEIYHGESEMLYRKSWFVDKISNHYYPHIAAYVQMYTEIRIEMFVLAHIDIKSIKKIWVDGIYYVGDPITSPTSEYHHSVQSCSSYCSSMPKNICANNSSHRDGANNSSHRDGANNMYTNSIEPIYYSLDLNNTLGILTPKMIVKGSAGTGKSTLLRDLYKQIPNSLVLVPTNELKKQYPDCNVQTIHYVIEHSKYGKKFDKYKTLLIDEYSMISNELIEKLYNINPHHIILFGDLGQLGIFEGSSINEKEYSIHILTKMHRQHDMKFQKKLNECRKNGVFDFNNKIDARAAINKKFLILSSTHLEIDRLNSLGIVLNDNELINGLKVGAPIRFYKTRNSKVDTSNNYNTGELGNIEKIETTKIIIRKEDGNSVTVNKETFSKYHKLAYSITYHAIQGKTLKDQSVAINTNKLFDKKMLYVGCSRVIDEDQLYMLIEL